MAAKTHKKHKRRLDEEAVSRDLVPSLEKAKALIMAGEILVNGQVVYKADSRVTEDDTIELKEKFPYVSRGAAKIDAAFNRFAIDVNGMKVMDIGISTGGFTDYMLQRGAQIAAGVDVNIQQVDDRLKKDNRLLLIKKNARHLEAGDIPFQPQLITMDVSFISITKILPALSSFPGARVLSLIKPQFEAPKEDVPKGGIIREKEKRIEILLRLKKKIELLNYGVTGFSPAGTRGRKGNREYFFLMEYGKKHSISDTIITHAKANEI